MSQFKLPAETLVRLHNLAQKLGMDARKLHHNAVEIGLTQLEAQCAVEPARRGALSKKQLAVLQHLKRGKSVKEIASELAVGENTVRTHITRLKEKLDRQDLLELRML